MTALSVASSMIVSLLLTIIIETAFAAILGVRNKHDIKLVIGVNLFTNPIVTFSINLSILFFGHTGYIITYVLAEAFAFISEWLIYSKKLHFRRIHPLALSIILNGITLTTGLIISYL